MDAFHLKDTVYVKPLQTVGEISFIDIDDYYHVPIYMIERCGANFKAHELELVSGGTVRRLAEKYAKKKEYISFEPYADFLYFLKYKCLEIHYRKDYDKDEFISFWYVGIVDKIKYEEPTRYNSAAIDIKELKTALSLGIIEDRSTAQEDVLVITKLGLEVVDVFA